MASDWRLLSGYTPFWANMWGAVGHGSSGASLSNTLPAGVTFVTASPAHPHAGAAGEKVMKFDMNSATHEYQVDFATGAALSAVIDNSKRWGLYASVLIDFNSLIPTASDFKIMGSSNTSLHGTPTDEWRIHGTATTGTVQLYINGSLAATSTSALPASGFRVLELWHILNATGGADLSTDQWVVRMSSAATGAVTWTTLININQNSTNSLTSQIAAFQNIYLGGTATHGSGKEMNICNVVAGWQDADNALGVIRLDRMTPDGETANAAHKDFNGGTGGAPTDGAQVDESGTGIPDDATTYDEYASSTSTTVEQFYTMSAPFYITGADADYVVLGVRSFVRAIIVSVGKGGSTVVYHGLSDGTTLLIGHVNDSLGAPDTAAWFNRMQVERLDPGGSLYTKTSLGTVECGVQNTVSGAVAHTIRLSTISAIIPYQLATETGTAVDAPISVSTTARSYGSII